MSEAEEIQIGRQSDAEIRKQMGVYDDAALQQYVTRIGQRLAQASKRPNLPWTFTVVNEPAVNAFALPGGFVYVTRGILPFIRNEAELAAVIGHEIGHVDGRHSVEAYSRQTLGAGGLAVASIFLPEDAQAAAGAAGIGLSLMFLRHGREAELEADQLGVRYTSASGWAPAGMSGLLNTLARLDAASGSRRGVPNWALTHPPAADRVQKVQEAVAAASGSGATATNQEDFERRLDGIVFGDSREKGMVRGNEFVHPVLRFAVRFPEGWDIVNTDEQVAAQRDANSSLAMVLQLVPNPSGSIEQTANAVTAKAGYRELSGDRTRINGLDAYVGTYEGTINQTRVGLRIAHIRAGAQTYVIAGVAPANQYNGAQPTFSSSIQTFRALSAQEADRIQPNRVDFHVVRPGETWESIARGPSEGAISAQSLAIMNGVDPGVAPRAGQRVRIVVGG
jgi:predicted Zn-dependent protease